MQSLGRNHWLLLTAASAGMFLSSLDFSVNVGLPDIANDLDEDLQPVYLIITVYIGATASLQLVAGKVADLYGLRRVYLAGLAIYGIAMFMIASASALEPVLAYRWVQAIANAVFLAVSPALITAVFPPRVRGTALGLMTAIGMGGMIVGSLGAGLIIDALGWRWIFLGRIPLTVLALLLAIRGLPVLKPVDRGSLDWISASLLVTGFPALLLIFALGKQLGWANPLTIAASILTLVMGYGLFRRQRHADAPLLEPAILRNQRVVLGLSANFLLYLSAFVCWFILPFFASDIVGANATVIGLLLALPAFCLVVSSPLGGLLADRNDPSLGSAVGFALVVFGLVSFVFCDSSTQIIDIAVRMAVLGIGMGIFQSSNLNQVMGEIHSSALGMGGALAGLSRNLGAMTSVALLGSLFVGLAGVSPGTGDPSAAYIHAFRISYAAAACLALTGTAVAVWPWFIGAYRKRSGSE